jgi:uncharacterized protein
VIVCDTGPLVAAALSNDADHAACVRLFNEMHAAGRDLLVPATVTAEVGHLPAREAGARVESLFLDSLAESDFAAVDLTAADYAVWPNWSTRTAVSRWALRTLPWSQSRSGSS